LCIIAQANGSNLLERFLISGVTQLKLFAYYVRCLVRWRFWRRNRPPQFAVHLTQDFLGHEARYLFLLLYFLCYSGRRVLLIRKIWSIKDFSDMGIYGRLAFRLKSISFSEDLPPRNRDTTLLTDDPTEAERADLWQRVILIDYNIFQDKRELREKNYAVIPYSMHPKVYVTNPPMEMKTLPASGRNVRLFFSGNTEEAQYSGNELTRRFKLLPRFQTVRLARELQPDRVVLIRTPLEYRQVFSVAQNEKFVLVDTAQFRIPIEKWLWTLSQCDFFLCPPGVQMPLCHNAVEAMAAGAIPVINYPEWFRPSLENRVNCLTFTDEASLAKVLEAVFSMDSSEINQLRRNVLTYYQQHLSPERFGGWIDSQPDNAVLFYNIEDPSILERIQPESVYLSAQKMAAMHE
jgi:hypothetical protein